MLDRRASSDMSPGHDKLEQDEIVALERRRHELLEEVATIDHFRSGSVTALVRSCGKPGCRCSEPGDPGHGPNLRLTYKVNGKTRARACLLWPRSDRRGMRSRRFVGSSSGIASSSKSMRASAVCWRPPQVRDGSR
jgi:hypothetical protein